MPGPRFVEVAVDAPGVAGGRFFTYALSGELADVAPGEAVLVEFGNRRAVGVVVAEAAAPTVTAKPVIARVRSDGPLIDALGLLLLRHVAEHYLAPPGIVARAMLPPGLLERIELVAVPSADQGREARPQDGHERVLAAVRELSAADGTGATRVDELPRMASRATLLRSLRALEAQGHLRLEWRVLPHEGRPRQVRWARLSDAGREVAAVLAAGGRPAGPALGPRQRELLADPELLASDGLPAARLADAHGASAVTGLAHRGLLVLETATLERRPLADRVPGTRGSRPEGSALSAAQAAAVERLRAARAAGRSVILLLEGETASGKTAVYSAAIGDALDTGRSALVLVPEIALAAPLLDRLRVDLGAEVAIIHSALAEGERADEWRRIREGRARVVVGTRTAVLAPPPGLGIVVVDEEHDAAYKADRTPRYQARDVAIELGRRASVPVVLGSATPDLVTLGRVEQGLVERVRLEGRQAGTHASVEVVDLRAELGAGNRGLLSEPLAAAIASLDRGAGERAILVINRRGAASVVLCRDCGYVQICPDCQRPLVFHAAVVALRCHHCGATAPVARRCPACGSARIRYLGGGTERVEQELGVRFPTLRVGRLDRDIVERKGAAERVLDAFTAGEIDVLVGTSLVTKGLDIPEVALVGVVSADVALNLPDERAAERTWQLLVQAVGRTGRGDRPGRAIIQTYLPDHPVIDAVASGDARPFIAAELERRNRFGSPPFGQLIKLTAADADREQALAIARAFAAELRDRATAGGSSVAVLGPVPAYVARRGGRWRFHVVLRGRDPVAVLGGDPGRPWSVDVDPESLL
jgi:primosomal protein N' (replication factor Y)